VTSVIQLFKDKYEFLSNFHILPNPMLYNGWVSTTSEAAFQAAKTLDANEQKEVAGMTPGKSKRAGRKVKLREDWLEVREAIMVDILRKKFGPKQMPLRCKLLNTHPTILVEGNWWNDNFWGYHLGDQDDIVTLNKSAALMFCDPASPHNHLGKALMLVREEIRLECMLIQKL